MTLGQITRDYTTIQNGVKHTFKVGEVYEINVPLGGDYVEAKKIVASSTGGESAVMTLVKIPNGYWQPTTSGVYVPPSSSTQTSSTETNASSKADANIKYIFLGVLLVGAVSYLVMKNKK